MLFQRYKNNPIIRPDPSKAYEKDGTYNPTAIVHENKVYLIYRAEGDSDVSTLCLATSSDGFKFKKHNNNPIIKPSVPEEDGGCEDPRIVKIGDTFYLTYTSYNGMQPVTDDTVSTSLAISKDLINWEKLGIIVKGIKAATIFPEKINKKYVMFIGGKNIRIAESLDLLNWKLDKEILLDVRKNMFDDRYVEVGPQPLIFKDKIILFHNTADKQGVFHPSLAILDINNPRKILYRVDKPLMTPTEDYELYGKVKNVIFGSGLVELNGTYFYYYGAADKYVGVATVEKTELENYLLKL